MKYLYTTQTANSNIRKVAEVKDTDFYLYNLYDGHLCKTLNGHLELAPAFLYCLYLTLQKTDISLRWTLNAGPKYCPSQGSWQ